MIEVDDILINKEVLHTPFTCDLSKCKGACCTMESEYGAPLVHIEIDVIKEILPVLKDYLPKEHWDLIEESGFWEEKEGQLMTKSLNKRACLFVYWDNDVAKCAIEKAYFEGKVDFRKPISCHLFPIRVEDFGGPVLRFENYKDCGPAMEYGNETGISIIEFCKDALIRVYGEEWYSRVKEAMENT